MSQNPPPLSATPHAVDVADPAVAQQLLAADQLPEQREVAAIKITALAPEGAEPHELAAATDKMVAETVKLDDFYQLGKYTYIVCLLAELMILSQVQILKNTNFILNIT